MRRHDVVSGILLILSIIGFTLAAPVLGQEKRQESADVVRMPPKDVITVLGKRQEGDLEKLGEEYFKTLGKPEESSTTLASSSSAPSGPDYGSTNAVQPPASNPASSIANPDPLTEPSSCSPSKQGLSARGGTGSCLEKTWSYIEPAFDDHGASHFRGALNVPMYHQIPAWHDSESNLKPNPNSNPTTLIPPSADPDFDWAHWINAEDPLPQGPVSPKEFGQDHVYYQVDPAHPPSTSGHAPGPSPTEPEPKHEVETPPPSNLGSPKEPDDEVVPGPLTSPDLDHQSLSADSQPVDLPAAIYAAKGKAKESPQSRRISGTARDVGNSCGPLAKGVATC
jgi:hypothetical protein